MDATQDFKAFQEKVQKALVATTRTVNSLANEDLEFQRTANPSVGTHLEQKSERLLKLASKLLKSAGKATNQSVSALDDADDVEIQWKGIVDVIDTLLEKADTCLDEYTGLIKRKDAPTPESGRLPKKSKSTTDRLEWSLKRANILKPQNAFEKKVENFETGPWKPLLTKKPHATVPLEESLATFTEPEFNTTQYTHPYEAEIQAVQYPEHVYEKRDPQPYLPVETTSAIWVDTYEGVCEMLEELKKAKEIAIDLEHHDFRTYTGLLSLMQISTREKDWIVDTLVPWRHKLEVLNQVFADPKIVKVLHGAYMDIIWLQRDLGLYVVGLFDTFHAASVLQYPARSLAFLLKKFADFDADKKYQMADWRIRPLPEEMFYYARSDTHYLLYIYDMMRNELVESSDRKNPAKDYIDQVVKRSKDVALQRYEHPYFNAENGLGPRGWQLSISKVATLYDGEQFSVYKAVHQWRDDMARREDENPFFLMSNQVLADIARVLPVDKKALWSLLDSHAKTLKVHLDELFVVIQEAKKRGVHGPTMVEALRSTYSDTTPKDGALAKAKAPAAPLDSFVKLDIQELKSDRSQLWGEVPLSTAWEKNGLAKTSKQLDTQDKITIPYPFVLDADAMEVDQPAEPTPQPEYVPCPAPSNEEFTIKGGGRKRKLDEANTESSEAEEEQEAEPQSAADPQGGGGKDGEEEADDTYVAFDDSDEVAANRLSKEQANVERKRQKKERKQAKEAKKAKKAAAEKRKAAEQEEGDEDEGGEEAEEEEEAFDYSKAPSVLHGAKDWYDGGAGKGGRKGKKPAFNPYGNKSGDGPKGARATNHVKSGGRSATFKK